MLQSLLTGTNNVSKHPIQTMEGLINGLGDQINSEKQLEKNLAKRIKEEKQRRIAAAIREKKINKMKKMLNIERQIDNQTFKVEKEARKEKISAEQDAEKQEKAKVKEEESKQASINKQVNSEVNKNKKLDEKRIKSVILVNKIQYVNCKYKLFYISFFEKKNNFKNK